MTSICKAIKKNGSPCRQQDNLTAGYCKYHQGIIYKMSYTARESLIKCSAIRKNGTPCCQIVDSRGDVCKYHTQ